MKKITLLIAILALFFHSFSIEVNFVKQFEGTSRAVAFYGDYCYVTTGLKINVLDVSDAENIQLVNTLMINSNNYVNTMVVDMEKEVLVVGMDYAIQIYSVANPVSPVLLTTMQKECNKAVFDNDNLIFGTDHIYIYDISDIANPVNLSDILIDFASGAFCINGNYLYSFTQSGYSGPHSIVSFDISDPSNPQLVTFLEIGPFYAPWPEELVAKDNHLFLALSDSLKVFDIQDDGSVTYNTWFVFPDNIHSFHIDGDNLYAGLESGLKIYDISDIENIQEIGGYDYETYIRDIDVNGNLTSVAGNTNGYKVLKTTNPANIDEKYFFPHTDISYGICFNDNTAFFSLHSRGLQAVDITNPVFPQQLGNCDAEYFGYMKFKNNAVFAMNVQGDDSLFVFDVSNVFQMSLANVISSTSIITDFVFYNDYLLVNEYQNGIRVYSISDPFNPEEVGFASITTGSEMAVDEDMLFIGGQYGMTDTARVKIAAYDISNLPQITFLNDYFFEDVQKYHIEKIFADSPYLYLGVRKGVVSLEYDNGFTVKDEQLYLEPDYIHCYRFLKDDDYIFFNAATNVSNEKVVKIIDGELQEEELNENFLPDAKYGQYFYSLQYKNGYSIYTEGEFDFPPPENFTGAANGCLLEFSWDPPSTATPSYYLIYQNGEQIDSVTGTSYTLDNYFSSFNEFYIVAGYIDPEGLSMPSNTVTLGIPGGYEVPYFEDFEYDCINWYSTPVVGNTGFYHCDSVAYEGDYSLAFYSEIAGSETKCGPQYIVQNIICPPTIARFRYKIPEKNGSYDKLYLYVNDVLVAGPFEMSNDWALFKGDIDVCDEFSFVFDAVSDNGGGIFIDSLAVDIGVGIDERQNESGILSLYPNPVINTLNVELNSGKSQLYNFRIYSADGNLVKQFNKTFVEPDERSVSIDTRNLESGVYFLKVVSGASVEVRKFLVK